MSLNILVGLPILVWCVSAHAQPPQSAQVPAAVQERLSRLLPSTPPALATAEQPPAFYDSATLYQYMDGAADAFQGYDMQALLHHEVRAGAVDLTIDIFDMGRLENAFGMYAAERSPAYTFVDIGAEGYRNEGIVNFFQDRYYVKLAGFGDGADAVLEQVASAISKKIGGSAGFPPLLAKLPPAGRKVRTERYLRSDPLGHPFLSPAYQALYTLGGADRTLMVSVGADAADATSRLQTLQDHFGRTGQWTQAAEFGPGAIRATSSVEGTLVAATTGPYVVILLNPSVDSATFFTDAVARLR
jgi:hypothetical protein